MPLRHLGWTLILQLKHQPLRRLFWSAQDAFVGLPHGEMVARAPWESNDPSPGSRALPERLSQIPRVCCASLWFLF